MTVKRGADSQDVDMPPNAEDIVLGQDELFQEYADMEGLISFEELGSDTKELVVGSKPKKEKRSQKEPKREKVAKEKVVEEKVVEEKVVDKDVPSKWSEFHLNKALQRALISLGFVEPTLIQRETLGKLVISIDSETGDGILDTKIDLIGTAPTGSGKTLAFGLPILHSILSLRNDAIEDQSKMGISALILVPTRELGQQVERHLMAVVKGLTPAIRIVTLIGGIALPKQRRLLKGHVDILIATPGRLSKFFQVSKDSSVVQHPIQERLRHLSFLVIDEVDRMTDGHHFRELDNIFSSLLDQKKASKVCYQTLVFSATLPPLDSIDSCKWVQRIPFQLGKQNRILVKATDSSITPMSTSLPLQDIQEYRVTCTPEERDVFLYYFILEHPNAKILVFVNSVQAIRYMVPMLRSLGLENQVWGIHSQMPQRQRFKNLEKFSDKTENLSRVLIATDVAGRGLDIPQVQYVLHYHVPRSLDIYVHRTGRTGRAGHKGTSLLLLTDLDTSLFQKWSQTVSSRITQYHYDRYVWNQLNERMKTAKKVTQLQSKLNKQYRDKSWEKKTASILDIDETEISGTANDDDSDPFDEKGQVKEDEERALEQELSIHKKRMEKLLSQPLIPRGFSKSFITKPTNAQFSLYNDLTIGAK